MKKFFIYCRGHAPKENYKLTIGNQEKALRTYAAKNKLEVDRVFYDIGPEHNELDKLLENINEHTNSILVSDISRFDRDLKAINRIMEDIYSGRIDEVRTRTDSFSHSHPVDKLLLAYFCGNAFFKRYENEDSYEQKTDTKLIKQK